MTVSLQCSPGFSACVRDLPRRCRPNALASESGNRCGSKKASDDVPTDVRLAALTRAVRLHHPSARA